MSHRHPFFHGLILGVLGLALAGCASTAHRLDGAWECLDPAPAEPALREVKVIADGHFAFGVPNGGAPALCAGGGTCDFDGKKYVEHITYHWISGLVGKTIVFDCRLKDGLWYHSAEFDLGGRPVTINEVWRPVGSGAELPPAPADRRK